MLTPGIICISIREIVRFVRLRTMFVSVLTTLGLLVGSPAPPFTATAHTGSTVSLSDFADKKLLLWFYPRASTGG
jgi:peroxiredoxin